MILWFFIVILLIQGFVFYINNQDLPDLKNKVELLTQHNDEKRVIVKQLEDKLYLLENDHSLLEEQARSDLLMKKNDETLFQYVDV
ncbi:MAG: hypothetical protein CMF41_04895 [Legionellales bacterium]|nr:hypothetical protein [Legionellales bacterium]|tara:strand:- start:113 stop:370 length:258 start_codon:yes stop_codon:yes gene_type:complete